ncbi:MAG: VCBS domain-containing protein, partial [Proteobacteria bacterium]|nr:VCBS domain-containing protein [Pseudomonadota bacterium]
KTITTAEDSTYVLTAADFGFSDANDTGHSLNRVEITTVPAAGTLTLNGSAVTAGAFVSVADITGGKLIYTPAGNANGTAYASFSFQVEDDGGTASGGVDLDQSANTLIFNVTAVNDAPVASGSATLGTVAEDTASPGGATVSSLFGGNFSDATDTSGGSTANTLTGIAVVGYTADAAKGAWQYSTDGTNWSTVGTVSDASALTLAAASKLRFVPAGDYNGAATNLSVRLIDSSASVSNGASGVDVSTNGNTTAISTGTVTLTTTITAVNDAPVAVADTGAVNEDATLTTTNLTGVIQGAGTDTDVDNTSASLVVSGAVAGTGSVTQGAGIATSLAGTYGHLTLAADGSYSYVADQAAADALATGATANDVFTYTVKDSGNLVSNTATLTITVTGTDDAPTVTAGTTTATGAITELVATKGSASADTASGTIAFADLDLADTHSIAVTATNYVWSGGTLTAGQQTALTSAFALGTKTDSTGTGSGTQAWSFSAADSTFDFLKAGETISATYTVSIDDGQSGVATQNVVVTVTGANDAPAGVNDTKTT